MSHVSGHKLAHLAVAGICMGVGPASCGGEAAVGDVEAPVATTAAAAGRHAEASPDEEKPSSSGKGGPADDADAADGPVSGELADVGASRIAVELGTGHGVDLGERRFVVIEVAAGGELGFYAEVVGVSATAARLRAENAVAVKGLSDFVEPGASVRLHDREVPVAEPDVVLSERAHDTACCKGMNECKGRGMCKTDAHDCAGKNECKGQGGCRPPDC